jgi:general secretion pathway protein D
MKYRLISFLFLSVSCVNAVVPADEMDHPSNLPPAPALPPPPSFVDDLSLPDSEKTTPAPVAVSTTNGTDREVTSELAAPSQLITPPQRSEQLFSFKFEGADLDTVMETYCQWTEKIYLKNDAVSANVTLKANDLTKEESIQVIEAILGMNNISLVPMGEKFIKVVQSTAPDLGGQGLTVHMDPDQEHGYTDKLVTQIIPLNNVQIPEVQAAVQHLMHTYGKIQTLEGSNSLMITDTEANVNRIRELIQFMDQASASIEPRIYEIQFADAVEISAKLAEIITMAQGDQAKAGASTSRTTAGILRARTTRTAQPAQPTVSTTGKAGSGLVIHGQVKVMADDRTNILFIFSQKANFDFFDKIIKVLDVEVDPAITFEVVNLEYADAEELSGTLNELVGAATGSRTGSSSSSGSRLSGVQRASSTSRASTSSTSRTRVTPNAATSTASIQNLSRLSEETRILADMRSNSVLLMGQKADIAALKEVIKSLDVMLEQVVIESAIFEIGLDNNLTHGIDWIYQNTNPRQVAAWDGQSIATNTVENVVSGAFSYYLNATGINSEFLINLSKTDTDARLVQTPVIMTTDNTEATLSIGEQRPVVTSTDNFASVGGSQRSNYEYKDIGIQLTVTPRINPQRFVVMELNQKADSLGGNVEIDGNLVPIIKNREFEASIAVPDGGTVVLGGLVSTEASDSVNKIPILGDIPLIGRYLFSSVVQTEVQRELIVLMTPYVMTNQDEMRSQTERIYKSSGVEQADWDNSWSESPLNQIPDAEDDAENDSDSRQNQPEERAPMVDESVSAKPEDPPTSSSPATENAEMQELLKSL